MKPTAEATIARLPITPVTGHPPGTRTGDASLDRIIEAVLLRDVSGVQGLLAFEEYACGLIGDRTSSHQPFRCPPGVAEGTVLSGILVSGVEGNMASPDGARRTVGLQLNSGKQYSLYTVVRRNPATLPAAPPSRGQFAVVFTFFDQQNFFPTYNVANGKIVSLDLDFPEPALMRAFEQGLALDYVLPPP